MRSTWGTHQSVPSSQYISALVSGRLLVVKLSDFPPQFVGWREFSVIPLQEFSLKGNNWKWVWPPQKCNCHVLFFCRYSWILCILDSNISCCHCVQILMQFNEIKFLFSLTPSNFQLSASPLIFTSSLPNYLDGQYNDMHFYWTPRI